MISTMFFCHFQELLMADLQPKLTELFAAPEVHTGAVLSQFGIRPGPLRDLLSTNQAWKVWGQGRCVTTAGRLTWKDYTVAINPLRPSTVIAVRSLAKFGWLLVFSGIRKSGKLIDRWFGVRFFWYDLMPWLDFPSRLALMMTAGGTQNGAPFFFKAWSPPWKKEEKDIWWLKWS